MRSLPYYEPKETLLQALEVNFSNNSLCTDDVSFGTYIRSQRLDYDNVCSVLSTLVSIEDLSTMQIYVQFMQSDTKIRRVSRLSFSFSLHETKVSPEEVLAPYVDDVVLIPKASLLAAPLESQRILALLPHKHEELPLKHPMRRYVASVEKVTRSTIQMKFKRNCFPGDSLMGKRFFVILRSRRTYFRYMYRAMQLLSESPKLRRYLFPIKEPVDEVCSAGSLPEVTLFNGVIASNSEQLQAVKQILHGPNGSAPYIVFGPPGDLYFHREFQWFIGNFLYHTGTGKTTTIVEAILQLRSLQPRSRILITATSNSACDTIALRICEYMSTNIRLEALALKESSQIALDVKPDHQLMRLYSRSIHAKGLKAAHPLLLKHSNCAELKYRHLCVKRLRQYGIIVATLCTVGRLVTENLGKCSFFTHIFIDEAGASTEPESLIGIIGMKQQDTCHVILSGDHKQLGAVIKSNRAANLGLGHSLMERLLRCELYSLDANGNYDATLQTRLRRNYRSHPEIVGLYNRLFYNDELIALAPPDQINLAVSCRILPNANFPIIFQATHGVTQREMQSMSSYNVLEVRVLCWYVKQLLCSGLGGDVNVKEEDIGIVAPYVAQCKLIKEFLNQQGYPKVEVGSVESYQGREKPVIIVTLVRSFVNMGFITNPRRINVILSRAKSLMILIGNPVTLRYHRHISFIINECKLHGNYLFKKKATTKQHNFLSDILNEE
ncbi:hypothetical protein KR222_009616, partial [Zaprionus bogoriensis]